MKLTDLFLNRYLYRDKQTIETQGSEFQSTNSLTEDPAAIPSGGAAQDINTGNVFINGDQIEPGTIPQTTLDVSNWGWGQTCAFTSASATQVNWGAGTFKSADGTSYSISAGNTGVMSTKNYIYLDLNISSTTYQKTTTPATAVGIGKVLIAVAQNDVTTATYNLSEATQIVGDNILANSINASKITTGQLIVGTNVGQGTAFPTSSAGSLAYLSAVGTAQLDSTVIVGGYIKTSLLTASNIIVGTLTGINITGVTITGSTLTTASSGQRVVLNTNNISYYDSSNVFSGQVYGDTGGMIMSSGAAASSIIIRGGSSGGVVLGYGSTNIMTVASGACYPYVDDTYTLGTAVRRWSSLYALDLFPYSIDGGSGGIATTGSISGSNLSGTNTGDSSGHSGLSTLSGNNSFTGNNTFGNTSGNYFNWVRATGGSPQLGETSARFLLKGSSVYYTSLINDSDRALKKNINSSPRGKEDILKLEAKSFEYNVDNVPGRKHLGFIAQDVEKIMPELVVGEEGEKGIMMVDLIPILVTSIQQLHKEIEDLKARLP